MGKYDLIKLEKLITTMYVLPFVTVWVDPEGVRLTKISQAEKDTYHTIPSYAESQE